MHCQSGGHSFAACRDAHADLEALVLGVNARAHKRSARAKIEDVAEQDREDRVVSRQREDILGGRRFANRLHVQPGPGRWIGIQKLAGLKDTLILAKILFASVEVKINGKA